MTREGEGMMLLNTCPVCGSSLSVWFNDLKSVREKHCVADHCNYTEPYTERRLRQKDIDFKDRRK